MEVFVASLVTRKLFQDNKFFVCAIFKLPASPFGSCFIGPKKSDKILFIKPTGDEHKNQKDHTDHLSMSYCL